MSTQVERIVAALRRHPEGITAVDFLLPDVIDGGKPITRVAARILDARMQGHDIVTDGERNGCVVYRLARPEPGCAGGQPAAPEQSTPSGLNDLSSGAAAGPLFTDNAVYGDAA